MSAARHTRKRKGPPAQGGPSGFKEKKSARRRPTAGSFKPGPDPRRHKFTSAECSAGFWAAVESIVTRYPEAVGKDGRHMVVNFLKSKTGGDAR